MITYLTICLCVLVTLQPGGGRRAAASLYAAMCLVHELTHIYTPGALYYILNGGLTSIVLAYLCRYGRCSQFTDNMIYVCIASILLNFYGLVIYQLYMDPASYNLAFHGVYILAILILLKKDREHGLDICDRLSIFRVFHNQRSHLGGQVR